MRGYRHEAERQSCIEKAVFEERGYYIVNIIDCGIFQTPFTFHYSSLLLHKCPSTKGVYNRTTHMHPYIYDHPDKDHIKKCSVCNIWIPDSVQTLWTLQNADTLSHEYEDSGFE